MGSFDPRTDEFSFLFNPRRQRWPDHFEMEGAEIMGLTPEGRTTIRLLQLNAVALVRERQRLLTAGYRFQA